MSSPRVAGLFICLAMSSYAQWLHYPTPGTPRAHDGSPNLSAKPPRASDGKPDLSVFGRRRMHRQAKMSDCLAYSRTSCREMTRECFRNISWTSWQISNQKNRRCGPKPLLCFANTRTWRVLPRGVFRRAFRAATLITTFRLKLFKHAA